MEGKEMKHITKNTQTAISSPATYKKSNKKKRAKEKHKVRATIPETGENRHSLLKLHQQGAAFLNHHFFFLFFFFFYLKLQVRRETDGGRFL